MKGKCSFSDGEIETKQRIPSTIFRNWNSNNFWIETTFNCITVLYEIDVISSCMLDGDVQGRNYVRM